MLQVINREFEKLKDLVQYINKISIQYGYLRDYLITREDNYNLFLNFDVPEVKQLLELAKLKEQRSEDCRAIDTVYHIQLEDNSSKTGSNIFFSELLKGCYIQAHFGFDGCFDLIKIIYDEGTFYFNIELRKFDFEESMLGWHTKIDKILVVQEIDYTVIYNHLVKLILSKGYLIDKTSLKGFEINIECIANWLNRKQFNKD